MIVAVSAGRSACDIQPINARIEATKIIVITIQ
jgi:hypothetical protein